MAFPSTSGAKQENLSSAWNMARSIAGTIKSRAQNLKNGAASGPVSAVNILDFITYLADAKLDITRIAGLTGISTYAQEQLADPTLDIAVEYSNLITQLDSAISWVITNLPKDANGYLLITQFAVENNGRTTNRTFSTAETTGLRTILDSLIAVID